MAKAIEGLTPPLLWKYFAEISAIPRCSKNETAIARHLLETAGRLGLEAHQDGAGNVVVRKPASPGRESLPMVCLQGHMDMVCEKNKDKVHDFQVDPLELVRHGNFLMANGTTLGADNGIAVATSLAIMEDTTLDHGPLEFLFTVDEETGLTGANNLERGFLRSQTLLNLDSEEEGALYVGCSGGRDSTGTWTAEREEVPGGMVPLAVKIGGLKGGHSGLEIHQGRGNSLKILGRLLRCLEGLGGRIARMEGGNKRNAIPREAEAVVFVPAGAEEEARQCAQRLHEAVAAEFATVDPGAAITVHRADEAPAQVLGQALQRRVLLAIAGLPHGVLKMSPDIPGLVETSTNLAILKTDDQAITIQTSQRSSVQSEIEEAADMVRGIFELSGAQVTGSDGYPGWKPNLASPILGVAMRTYKDLYGREPEVKAVHAGLECGIIGEKYPGMDMVSLGPTLEGVHSPDEKIYIDTVEKFWDYVLAILKNVGARG
ncbi:MAG TPA: aminoacyl-histidine dipeptidase [Vicinamibacterales bacterium]|nr:aminoacyl-histidine dipeptidase [Vicinamibacterales bacterium]